MDLGRLHAGNLKQARGTSCSFPCLAEEPRPRNSPSRTSAEIPTTTTNLNSFFKLLSQRWNHHPRHQEPRVQGGAFRQCLASSAGDDRCLGRGPVRASNHMRRLITLASINQGADRNQNASNATLTYKKMTSDLWVVLTQVAKG
jgi:hypothetical protein